MKQIALIGIGNCGSQAVALAEEKYPELFDCVYINTSESDLGMVNSESLKIKIGENDEVYGSGKNRNKMKAFLREDIKKVLTNEDLIECIRDKKYVFIISSCAGGTGSGASPAMFEMLRTRFVDPQFVLVGVLPKLQDSMSDQGNSLEYLNELYETLGNDTTYMIYDNDTVSHMSPTRALEVVNENIIEDIRIITGIDNFPTKYESIDSADMESLIRTPGRLIVARIKTGLSETEMEENQFDEKLIKAIKSSAHAETDRNKRVVRWGIITHLTEQVNALYDPKLEKLVEFIGTPQERFNHNSVHEAPESQNFIYLIAAGLSPINDRAKKMSDRVRELKEALAKDDTNTYRLSDDSAVNDALEIRNNTNERMTLEKFNPESIMDKFMK